MGLGSIFPSARIGAPAALKRALRLGALAALALGFAPGRAAAQNCPGTVTGSYTLTGNITANISTDSMPCITVGAPNTVINLAGYTIDVRPFGDAGVAIDAGANSNTSILGNGGAIVTAYSSGSAIAAVEASGGTNLTITGVTVANDASASTVVSTLRDMCLNPANYTVPSQPHGYGAGILVQGVTGATIGSNNVCFYQYGVSVQNSAIPSGGTGSISGNVLNLDAYYMFGAGSPTYSGGLVLSNSSGWTVTGNTLWYDGAGSTDGTCTSPTSTTGVNSCAFSLQIINGSSSNSLTSNTADYNFVGGIYTGPDTTGNSIISNTALSNGLWDLWDDAPAHHANSWHKNTCSSAGGTLNPHSCHN